MLRDWQWSLKILSVPIKLVPYCVRDPTSIVKPLEGRNECWNGQIETVSMWTAQVVRQMKMTP